MFPWNIVIECWLDILFFPSSRLLVPILYCITTKGQEKNNYVNDSLIFLSSLPELLQFLNLQCPNSVRRTSFLNIIITLKEIPLLFDTWTTVITTPSHPHFAPLPSACTQGTGQWSRRVDGGRRWYCCCRFGRLVSEWNVSAAAAATGMAPGIDRVE